MIDIRKILIELKKSLCNKFEITQFSDNFIKINTPFKFEDGDNVTIGLKIKKDKWIFTDVSETFLHLSHHFGTFNFNRDKRKEKIEDFLEVFSTKQKDGELYKNVNIEEFSNDFYDFLHCVLKISDITILEREIVEKTFRSDLKYSLKQYLTEKGFKSNIDFKFDFFHQKDKNEKYKIDCYIETKQLPIFIFAVGSEYSCRGTTIAILMLERIGVQFHPIAFFKDEIQIQQKVAIELTDVARTISSLEKFDMFKTYFESLLVE